MVRIIVFLLYYLANLAIARDVTIVLITLPTFLVILFSIYRIKTKYLTFQDVFWFVSFLFFVIGPVQTFDSGHFAPDGPVGGMFFATDDVVDAGLVHFIALSIFAIIFYFYTRRPRPPAEFTVPGGMVPLLAIGSIVGFGLFIVASGGVGNMLAARHMKVAGEGDANLETAVLAIEVIPTLMLCLAARSGLSKGFPLFTLMTTFFCLCLLLLAQNPLNAPRNFLLQNWLPVILITLRGRFKALHFYILALVGLVVVMPILSMTTRFGANSLATAASMLTADKIFTIPYVDVYDMMTFEMRWFHSHEFFDGWKTISLILFFVPRAIWTGKATLVALDIGNYLASAKVAGTANLSLFVAGDFYADYGFAGVVGGTLVLAILMGRIFYQKAYLLNGQNLKEYMLLSATPILIRGPLGANVPLFFCNMILLTIMIQVITRRVRSPVAQEATATPKRAESGFLPARP
jgi:hypothetical protein